MAKASKPITLREWQAIVDCYLKRMAQPGKTDKDVEKIEDWFAQGTNDSLQMPVRSFDDLVVLAAIAVHWNSNPDADLTYPQFMVDSDPAKFFDKRSLARLVKGILDLAKVRLDSDGRQLSFPQHSGT